MSGALLLKRLQVIQRKKNDSRRRMMYSHNLIKARTEIHLETNKYFSTIKPSANKPKKKPDLQSFKEKCVICLEDIMEKGKSDACNHPYCYNCVLQWCKLTNSCPICKRRFRKINKMIWTRGSSTPKVVCKEFTPDRNLRYDYELTPQQIEQLQREWLESDAAVEEWIVPNDHVVEVFEDALYVAERDIERKLKKLKKEKRVQQRKLQVLKEQQAIAIMEVEGDEADDIIIEEDIDPSTGNHQLVQQKTPSEQPTGHGYNLRARKPRFEMLDYDYLDADDTHFIYPPKKR